MAVERVLGPLVERLAAEGAGVQPDPLERHASFYASGELFAAFGTSGAFGQGTG